MNKYYARRKLKEVSQELRTKSRELKRASRYCYDENEYYHYFGDKEKEIQDLQEKLDYYYSHVND